MVFGDFPWLIDQYDLSEAISVWAYALVFALGESLLPFIIMLAIYLLLPKKWKINKRFSLIYITFFVLMFWTVVSQLFALGSYQLPGLYINLMQWSGHPLWVLYGTALVFTGLSILIPLFFWLRSPDFHNKVINVTDRIVILSWLYLILDLGSIIMILYRNIF